MSATREDCARSVIETVPAVMRVIRREMRSQRTAELSVPQFRTLAFLDRHGNVSLTDVAEHLGLTAPSASKLVDGLVNRNMIRRESSTVDRRRIDLTITPPGKKLLQGARAHTHSRMMEKLSPLSPEQLAVVAEAMRLLHSIYADDLSDRALSRE
jgi:DNA-binding MarR family transcriptional regulator